MTGIVTPRTDLILPGDPEYKSPEDIRNEIDESGLDWETGWLLEDSEEEDDEYVEKGDLDLDARLNRVDYAYLMGAEYKPSVFAYEMVNFIKLVNGVEGEENVSPVIHYDMFDQVPRRDQNLYVSFRGSAKTTALHEYMILYLATYGKVPTFGQVDVGIYISDTMDNGVKSMRTNLEFRWSNSEFLQRYVPVTKFTDVRWEFQNADGKKLCFRGFGASTGVRGFKEYGQRPTWAGFDDLMSDKNAVSPTIQKDIKHIIYKAARQALHPKKRMQIWTGTPFNKSDPLYEAAGSGAWNTRVYPICEKFPVSREEFRGGWGDRFNYDFVKKEFRSLKKSGEIASFNQELMLRITSDEDRLVNDHDLVWYERDNVIRNRSRYNFYITTDFATVATVTGDYSVIMVWAYSNNGEWLLVDGICKKQLMDQNIKDLFRLVSVYKPMEVGIEINGQQTGFVSWIKNEMVDKNIFFNLAGKGTIEGIRRSGKKIDNFKLAVPIIKAKKLWLPKELANHPLVVELVEEFRFATGEGFKSKNDDASDGFSMLLDLDAFRPGEDAPEREYVQNEEGTYALFPDEDEFDDECNSTVF